MWIFKPKVEKRHEKTLKIVKKSLFFPLFGKKSFLNQTRELRKYFLNQATCVLKNRLHPQTFLNRDSFLNQAFLNRDSTVCSKKYEGDICSYKNQIPRSSITRTLINTIWS